MQNASDLKGKTFSLDVNHLFSNGISVEAGRRDFDSGRDEDFVNLSYKLKFGDQNGRGEKSKAVFASEMFSTEPIAHRMMEKVRRTNNIVKQSAGFTISFR